MSLLANTRRGVGKKGDTYPKVTSLTQGILYTRTSSSNLSPNAVENEDFCGIVIDMGADTYIDSISFSCGTQKSSTRFLSYNGNGDNQTQHVYNPSPRTATDINANIKTIYFSVFISNKENAYIYDDTNGKYIFNGATFDWSKYEIE